ncbi:MAG: MFS transporter [Dehalococcoidia bacterium]|jgi:MFS family permease|nr:MFS transporter [Dehalococcoidia bacterium]MDP7084426.1 MFS transporter [Dehalococcoidia bacterium]MDP7200931.1 MFS transporter [Dehalococcoidia bacterium]MDP7510129.1 MFS transporter [Dehalococcoidia bacterium]HJN85927.1 MFS transporter [Dehalococcoidia bacterium]
MEAAAAGLGMFLAALDISVNVALPSITRDFDTDLQTVQWIIVAFIATRAGLVLGAGSFGDRFGLRPVYLFGVLAYMAAMVLIAFSPTLEIVVGFRVLQAVATGCLFAVSPALAARAFPVQRRGLGMGFTAASQALGMLTGTLGAGLLVGWFGWESVFLGRLPFALLALFLAVSFLKREERSSSGRSFDVAGAVTLIAGVLCLVVALRLGRSAGWTSREVLVLLALAPVFLAVFWRAEGRAVWPVLPRDLLRVRGVFVSGASMFLAHLGVFVIWFIFPFYISGGLSRGPFSLGIMLAAMALFNAGFSGFGGWLCDRTGALPVGVTGLAVMAGGLAGMSFLDADSSLPQVGVRIAVVGMGLGLFQSAAYASMMGSVAPDRLGTASAALSLSQAFGTVLSVAVIGGLFALIEERHLSDLAGAGLTLPEQEGRAFITAFQDIFRLGASIAALGSFVFLLSPRKRARVALE